MGLPDGTAALCRDGGIAPYCDCPPARASLGMRAGDQVLIQLERLSCKSEGFLMGQLISQAWSHHHHLARAAGEFCPCSCRYERWSLSWMEAVAR